MVLVLLSQVYVLLRKVLVQESYSWVLVLVSHRRVLQYWCYTGMSMRCVARVDHSASVTLVGKCNSDSVLQVGVCFIHRQV